MAPDVTPAAVLPHQNIPDVTDISGAGRRMQAHELIWHSKYQVMSHHKQYLSPNKQYVQPDWHNITACKDQPLT
jgi:hypothetical protein